MKKITILLITVACFAACTSGFSQSNGGAPKKASKADSVKSGASPWGKVSLDFSAGSRGVGLGGRYGLGKKWGVRLGLSYLPLTYNAPLTLSGYHTNINLFNNFTGAQLLFEFKPTQNWPVKFIAGFSYFFVANLNAELTPTGIYKFGVINLTSDQIGSVTAKFDWSGIAPFIGIGISNPHPKHKVGFSLGLGLYYLPEPKVSVTGTNFLVGNFQNESYLANNMESYRYLPVVNFHVNYRFKKN
jgi:hypothetical protein